MSPGRIIILTGNGKGKTTSALGRCFKGWTEGKKILFLQFIKGDRSYGELKALEQLGESFKIKQLGLGFVKNSDKHSFELHHECAQRAFNEAVQEVKSSHYDIIVLDEINYAVHFGLISEEQVVSLLEQKPAELTLILTGRYARSRILEKSGEVIEFREARHYAAKGIIARPGIEF